MFEKNSSFHVKKRTTGKVQFLFSMSILLVSTKFSFCEGDWVLGYNSMKFWHYSELSKFLNNLSLLSCSATRQATRIYQFITNTQVSFHLCWKKNLLKHQKFSKCYDHGCSYSFLFWRCLFNYFSLFQYLGSFKFDGIIFFTLAFIFMLLIA